MLKTRDAVRLARTKAVELLSVEERAQAATDGSGCVTAGVFYQARPVFQYFGGLSDGARSESPSARTVFQLGSLSKQFTGMGISLLCANRRLSPNDAICKYMPELPRYCGPLRVRHLLHHTSGLPDYTTLMGLAERTLSGATVRDVIDLLARRKALMFAPGSRFCYSNSGYALLAARGESRGSGLVPTRSHPVH